MSTHPQRVADNILPLSLAGTLPEAFKEWYFTENIEDHEIAEEDCELCDQEQLRCTSSDLISTRKLVLYDRWSRNKLFACVVALASPAIAGSDTIMILLI